MSALSTLAPWIVSTLRVDNQEMTDQLFLVLCFRIFGGLPIFFFKLFRKFLRDRIVFIGVLGEAVDPFVAVRNGRGRLGKGARRRIEPSPKMGP